MQISLSLSRRSRLSAALALALALVPAYAADLVEGVVLAFDRVANVVVLTDKSVWSLETLVQPAPADLQAGDRIEIRYESNEDDGIKVIHSIAKTAG